MLSRQCPWIPTESTSLGFPWAGLVLLMLFPDIQICLLQQYPFAVGVTRPNQKPSHISLSGYSMGHLMEPLIPFYPEIWLKAWQKQGDIQGIHYIPEQDILPGLQPITTLWWWNGYTINESNPYQVYLRINSSKNSNNSWCQISQKGISHIVNMAQAVTKALLNDEHRGICKAILHRKTGYF